MDIVIPPSTKTNTKYDARSDGAKTVSFGGSNYSDFTRNKNTDRKEAYKKESLKRGLE